MYIVVQQWIGQEIHLQLDLEKHHQKICSFINFSIFSSYSLLIKVSWLDPTLSRFHHHKFYLRKDWSSFKIWSGSGNFSLRGGPSLNPDQIVSDLPSSSVTEISKLPRLTSLIEVSESISSTAKGEEAITVRDRIMHRFACLQLPIYGVLPAIFSAARFLNTCQDLQWAIET